MFTYIGRIRYSETDGNGVLTLPALFNYFQDTFDFHAMACGLGVDYLAEKQLGWIISYWHLDIHRLPVRGEEIAVDTFPTELSRLQVQRNFRMYTESGETLVTGYSIWLMMDFGQGKLVPVPEEFKQAMPSEERPIRLSCLWGSGAKRRVMLPDGIAWEAQGMRTVEKEHLDTNQHMNNVAYIRMLLSALADERDCALLREVSVEYKKQAYWHQVLQVMAAQQDGADYVEIFDEEAQSVLRAVLRFGTRVESV